MPRSPSAQPQHRQIQHLHVLDRSSQRRFLFDYEGIKESFDALGRRKFHRTPAWAASPWHQRDSIRKPMYSRQSIELADKRARQAQPEIRSGGGGSSQGRQAASCGSRRHPSVSSFFNTDDAQIRIQRQRAGQRSRLDDQFADLMGQPAITTTRSNRRDRCSPHSADVLVLRCSKTTELCNGRVFTDDVIDHRLAFLSKGEIPPTGLKPHTDILKEFPYIGTPHQKKS